MILRFILVSVLHQRPTFLCTKEAENGSIMTTEQKLLLTNGFAQVWLDKLNFSIFALFCFGSGPTLHLSAFVLNFSNTIKNGLLYRAGQSMNPLPSQIPGR